MLLNINFTFTCTVTALLQYFSSYQLSAHFLYSITIYMLHYNPVYCTAVYRE